MIASGFLALSLAVGYGSPGLESLEMGVGGGEQGVCMKKAGVQSSHAGAQRSAAPRETQLCASGLARAGKKEPECRSADGFQVHIRVDPLWLFLCQ